MAGYVVITPMRDEARFAPFLLSSLASQTVLPADLVLVDDGSTDGTGELLNLFVSDHPWAQVVHRRDRGKRLSGQGIMDAFYDGYEALRTRDWEYLAKLDGDVSIDSGYFEACIRQFEEDPQLGIGGGRVWVQDGGRLVKDSPGDPRFHVRGATKLYRRACWDAIGGLGRAAGWDTLDEVTANMMGWSSYPFDDLVVRQHRHTGGADGIWKTWTKNGRANYEVGYHPLFMLGKFLKRSVSEPYLVGGVALLWGFVGAYLRRNPRMASRDVVAYLRRQQMRRMFGRTGLYTLKRGPARPA